jgi:hypothetical protein
MTTRRPSSVHRIGDLADDRGCTLAAKWDEGLARWDEGDFR